MADVEPPKSEALRAMYWRSEILQVMYWLRGEGLGELVDRPLIERFLGVEDNVTTTYLDRLVDEGFLDRVGSRYALSPGGLEAGAVEFAIAFDGFNRPSHGECSDDCWCHMSADEAEACVAERRGHEHLHGDDG